MGIREIFDGARTKISQLAQLVVVDDEPLSNVDGAALDAELKARKAWAERRQRKPEDGAVGKIAGSGAVARAQRERLATERAKVVHRDRDDRAARAKAAADDAFRRVKEQAARGGGSSAGSSSSGGSPPRPPRGSNAAQLTEWYKQLDVQPGADLAEIKSAYRKMMRKYHPDLQADPTKKRAATELTMRVNTAYNGLVEYLEKK
ncbi:MAG: J domain-containing protein [Deltaproteobacteria bacterium]|nr:J domain-containing protein [Deltaproteobacteria bacterium]